MNNAPTPRPALLHLLGLAFCIVPPSAATILYFPIWSEMGGGRVIAGGGVLLAVIFAMPLFKWINRLLHRSTPYLFWTVLFILFLGLSKIADEMTVISFAGCTGNIIGALIFKLERKRRIG